MKTKDSYVRTRVETYNHATNSAKEHRVDPPILCVDFLRDRKLTARRTELALAPESMRNQIDQRQIILGQYDLLTPIRTIDQLRQIRIRLGYIDNGRHENALQAR